MFTKARPADPDMSTAIPAPARTRDAAGGRGTTFSIIGADVTVTGNIVASVDLHIDGRIEGDVRCASLVQGGSSTIVGSVVADSAKLAGTVEGAIEATDLVIESSARIKGDVSYEKLRIEQGGQVEGSFRHRAAHMPSLANKTVALPRENPTLELNQPL